MLRITQDWDEVSEGWKPRGNWLFLQLIEEVEQEWPPFVSVKQIWYDLRIKNDFKNLKEWTSSEKDVWKKLVLQVISDNFKLTVKEFFRKLHALGDLMQEGQALLELSESVLDAVLKPEVYFGNSLDVVLFSNTHQLDGDGLMAVDLDNSVVEPVEKEIDQELLLLTEVNNNSLEHVEEEIGRNCLASGMEYSRLDMNPSSNSVMPSHEEALCVPPLALSILPSNPDEISRINSNNNSEGFPSTSSKMPSGNLRPLGQRKRYNWLPASHEMVLEAEFCPDAIIEYDKCGLKERRSSALTLKANKHLLYLGWKIEYARDNNGRIRLRYTSPNGKSYNSLRQACQHLNEPRSPILSPIPQDDQRSLISAPDGMFSSQHIEPKPRVSSPPDVVVIEPEPCPQAILDYYFLGEDRKSYCSSKLGDMSLKVKQHLSAIGWSFYYDWNRGRKDFRCCSPTGKLYYSLRAACKSCIDQGGYSDGIFCTSRQRQNINIRKEGDGQLAGEGLYSPLLGTNFQKSMVSQNAFSEKCAPESSAMSLSGELVELGNVKTQEIKKLRKKRKNAVHLPSHLLQAKDQNVGSWSPKKGKGSKALIKLRDDMDDDFSTRVMRSSKRARQVVVPSSSHQTPRTVLSWLIDNNVVLPRAKVHYRGRKNGRQMAEGRITRDGIKCTCCQNVFTLSKFEAHAGSTFHRPSANIFLEDGRSLLECQLQLKHDNNVRSLRTETRLMKCNRVQNSNDYICSVCHYGGELVLCDQCPSAFHTHCLGLKDVPEGDWFCPSCCCGLCGESRCCKDTEQSMNTSVLICDQCERQYHVGCLRTKGLVKLGDYPKGNWFCDIRCEQIFLGLRRLLGKPIPVGVDNLNWTLLKYMKSDSCDYDASDEALTENYSKLNVALGVMHECFEPVKEPRTRRDLVEDVVFNRRSELNRLNFRGFYTVLLERNDELITVATVRVYGEKVAEVPLVATRFQYRRLGMCRILMNELEKKLMELGVKRLVLPAVPNVLNTWTTSFGFSMMTESERLNFLDHTFLDFQGTIMCQKLLMEIPSSELSPSRETQQKHHDDVNGDNNIDLDGNSAVSEVFQADQVQEIEIVNQGSMDIAVGEGRNRGDDTGALDIRVNQPTDFEADYKEAENKNNGHFKCYKRRRISACGS